MFTAMQICQSTPLRSNPRGNRVRHTLKQLYVRMHTESNLNY